jgi:hypothetical protein
MLNLTAAALSVAEYKRTGMLTNPNEIESDAIERAAMRNLDTVPAETAVTVEGKRLADWMNSQ